MNSYTKHQISRFYDKYITRQFDQDDVSLLIVLVRDYTKPGSIFRELGDFLAHPSAKDRGLVIDSFLPIVGYFETNNNIDVYQDGDNVKMGPTGLGIHEEIHSSLSDLFALIGINYLANNSHSNPFRDLVFCLIFLLSNFKIQLNNKLHDLNVEYGHSLRLNVLYANSKNNNHRIVLPVLFLGNVWISCIDLFYKKQLKDHIVRRFNNGNLAAISSDLDIQDLNSDMGSFQRGEIWPSPDFFR